LNKLIGFHYQDDQEKQMQNKYMSRITAARNRITEIEKTRERLKMKDM
jgi:hypothetical protein